MPVNCKIDNTVIVTQDARNCIRYGGVVVGEDGTDPNQPPSDCFVRNVLTRTLGSLVLDVGWADGVSPEVVDALAIPAKGRRSGARGRKRGMIRLTSAKRRAVIAAATRAILRLAATYPTTVKFRDRLLLTTPRGRQWKRYYDRHLAEIFRVAEWNLDLMNAAATTWLALYPFVRAMVRASSGRRSTGAAVSFKRRDHRACLDLIRRFRRSSQNSSFRKVLDELDGELAPYVGLTAEEAVEKLQKSRPKHA